MFSSKIKVLAICALALGAANYAFACGDKDKTSDSQASYSSTEGSTGCTRMTKEACAAKMAAGQCSTKGAKASHAVMASGSSCAHGDMASECVYGENTVTMAGTCPANHEADYSFAIAGAECQGTGAAAAKAIKSVRGVASVTIDYDKHMAYVCADNRTANQKAIAKSLKKAGFDDVKFVSASKENCAKSHGKLGES